MDLVGMNHENVELEILEEQGGISNSSCAELPGNSHFSPVTRVGDSRDENHQSGNIVQDVNFLLKCCICVTPLLHVPPNDRLHPNFGQFPQDPMLSYFEQVDVDILEKEKLFKILDIHPLDRDLTGDKTYPTCKPCFIEITKYEKLQTEIQRIVDQIVTTVLENLEYQNGTNDGENPMGFLESQHPLEGLRSLIFKRWKSGKYDSTNHEDQLSKSSTSSGIVKAIFQALHSQSHELISGNNSAEKTRNVSISSSNINELNVEHMIGIRLENIGDDFKILNSNNFTLDERPLRNLKNLQKLTAGSETLFQSSVSPNNDLCNADLPIGSKDTSQEISVELTSQELASANSMEGSIEVSSEELLNSHTDRRGPFICTRCKKEFRQQRDLDVHDRRQHTGERPFICEICGKAYPAKSALHHHRKIHSQRFVCDICGAAVVTETGLKKHMQIHEGTKQFFCEICSKAFMWKQSLLKHQVLHTDSKPFMCQICNRTFPIKDYLTKHSDRRHPEKQEGLIASLKCPYCSHAKFRTPGNLSSHILRKHSSASASFI